MVLSRKNADFAHQQSSMAELMDTTHPDLSPGQESRPPADRGFELRRLGEFQILRRLGEGGMGAVFLAFHEGQGAQFAIKVLADLLAMNQSYVDRFYREARSGILLHHPNIVRCLAVGQDQATSKHYLVMEYVDGPSVQTLLEMHGKISIGDAVHIALDIARGLEHAHSRNIVHRDIKPGNILISLSGIAKLADLGLAKRTDEASHLTGTKQTFGTPHYMPYEQAMNARNADNRSDIYALGATLYHLVTGEVPFPGDSHLDVVEKKHLGKYRPARLIQPTVPRSLDMIIARMLARDPRGRYQTASELIIDLERSRLSAPMLSFTDPVLALQDPWVRAQLASDTQPTRPDMHFRGSDGDTPKQVNATWFLRYQDGAGKTHRYRATVEQILNHLRANRMPGNMEASPQRNGAYQPLATFTAFQLPLPAPARRRRKAVNRKTPAPPSRESASLPTKRPRRLVRWALLAGVGLGAVVLLVVWFLCRSPN
jgi:eukaryotic-like serine/threonine-protein kinase